MGTNLMPARCRSPIRLQASLRPVVQVVLPEENALRAALAAGSQDYLLQSHIFGKQLRRC
jgi:hypothetical protein